MATDTKTVLLDISVSYKDAINGIVQLQKQLDELSVEQMKVNAAFKNGEKSREQADKELEAITAQTRLLKQAQREYRKEIDANLQAEEANAGSLKQMRAELKNLLKEYDELSQTDREAIGGVGEEKLVEIRRLQEELRNAEEASGRFQRSVGSYEDAIKRALNGTIPMKTAVKDLKNEIQTLEFQYRNQGTLIQQQEKDLNDLANTIGKDNDEYRQQEAELQKLKQDYADTGDALTKMKQAAGNMTDAIKDSNEAINNFAKDNANLKAMTQGAELLLNGYTALKAGMTALGLESEELYNVFSKIQILQQGLNAVNKIANMLEKQSLISQQARVLWTNLTTTSIATLTAAKKKDAVASGEAAAADVTLAAGETAATGAAGALTVALKAVGAAIKSIPIIGWLLAAVAALGTITALIVKNVKAERANNDELRVRRELMNEIKDLEGQVLESTQKQVVAMEANVKHLKEATEGTDEWDRLVKEVAGDLGVDEEWLKKNVDKVDELKDAWIRLQKAMALGQAAAQKMAENQIKIATAEYEIRKLLDNTDEKKRTEELKKQFGMSEKMAQNIASAYHQMLSKNTSKSLVDYSNAVNSYTQQLEDQNKRFGEIMEQSYDDQKTAQDDLAETAEGHIKDTGDKASKTGKTVAKNLTKTAKELMSELEDLMVEGMADGLEKQIKEVEKASERYVAKMKEARDKDKENAEYYDKIILEKERQTQDKIKKMRDDGYKNIIQSAEKVSEAYNKLWQSYAPNSFYNFVKDVEQITKDVNKSVDELNKQISDLQEQITNYRDTKSADLNLIAADKEAVEGLKKQLEDIPAVNIPVKPVLKKTDLPTDDDIRKVTRPFMDKLLEKGWLAEEVAVAMLDIGDVVDNTNVQTSLKEFRLNLQTALLSDEELSKRMVLDASDAIFQAADELYKTVIVPKINYVKNQNDYEKQMAAYNSALAKQNEYKKQQDDINGQIADKEKEIEEINNKIVSDDEEIVKLEGELAEKQKNYNSDFAKQLLINRQTNKAIKEYAKTMQEVLLEQAKLGNISIIPDDFGIYIDYQIDALEEKLAKSYNKLEQYASNMNLYSGVMDENDELYDKEIAHFAELQAELKAYREAKKRTFVDMNEKPEDKGFFNNEELIQNAANIQQVQNQIKVMTTALEEGRKEQEAINRLEQENEQLALARLGLLAEINSATDEETKNQLQNQLAIKEQRIAYNNELINSHKETMALMGYTTEEEMQQTLDGLNKQEKAFAKETDKIMKQTAVSVLQAISTMTGSLVDLFNEMGEDNADMANFLEGIAYAQIGVNMAVGIAEAIAAGAGVAFPANLVAIATGVAAVISGIASAISTYKQYHKDVASPSFADGGLIGMRTARTMSEGTRDDIRINASRGEYVIKADKVKQYGVDFFDSINYGKRKVRRGGLNFADGGYVDVTAATKAVANEESYAMLSEALQNMPSPVVSVQEITKVQNKVKVKEITARR